MNAILGHFQQTISNFWLARNARERKQIGLAIAVAVCGLLYMMFIGPALSGRTQLQKSMPSLHSQAAELQNLAQEAGRLSAITAAPVAAMSKESLEATLTSKGIKSQSVTVSGELAKVQLTAVSFSALLDWLDESQKSARITVVDASIVAQPQTDIVNATLTLRQ